MATDCKLRFCSSIQEIRSLPLHKLSRYFYHQSRFFCTHPWKTIWTSLVVTCILSTHLALTWNDRNGASGSSAETKAMFSVKGGKYFEWHREYNEAFNFTVDRDKDYWQHHQNGATPLNVVLRPKIGSKIDVNNSEFWEDMKYLCDLVHFGSRQKLEESTPFSLWKSYVCGKRNGSCYEPWSCNRHTSTIDNYDRHMEYFKQNTKITNPKFLEKKYAEIGDSTRTQTKTILTVDAMLLVWHQYPDELGYYWNYKTYNVLMENRHNLNCCTVNIHSAVAFLSKIDEALAKQIPIFAATVGLILLFTIAINWKHSLVHSRSSLAVAVIICTFMAIGNGIAVGKILGIPYIALVSLTPFIVLGVGIDSGLILIRSWSKECVDVGDPVERTARSIEKTFSSIFMSDLTSLLAFATGSFTKYPAVNCACQYLALQILFLFICECTFLTACLVLHNRRVNNFNHCLCCWDTVEDGEEHFLIPCYPNFNISNVSDNSFEKDLVKIYQFILRNLWTRISVMIFTALLFSVAVVSLLKMETAATPTLFIEKHSQLEEYFQLDTNIAWMAHETPIIIENPIDYWNNSTGQKLKNLRNDFLNLDFCDSSVKKTFEYSWIEPFYELYSKTGDSTPQSFYETLDTFLKKYPVFESDLKIENYTDEFMNKSRKISRSRFIVPMVKLDGMLYPEEANRQLKAMEKIMEKFHDFDIRVCLGGFQTWEAMIVVKQSTWKTILLALAICCVTVSVLVPENAVFLAVVFTTGLSILSTLGFMSMCGLTYNMLTYTQIIISIGLSIDYMSHSGYSFAVEFGTPLERSQKSLAAMGIALTNAALSSLLGISLLFFTTTRAFQSFFISFSILFSLSFYYGVIFLPVLLSFLASTRHPDELTDDTIPMQTIQMSSLGAKERSKEFKRPRRRRKEWTKSDLVQSQPNQQESLLNNEHMDSESSEFEI